MKSRYNDESDAIKELESEYQYWSGKLTESSFQLCIAILAANWAVYQDVNKLRENSYAVWSICLVIATLVISLLVAKRMSEAHRERCEYAEADKPRWAKEHNTYRESNGGAWPFTDEIENIGWISRLLKTWLPLVAGVLFCLGALSN
jgi:hypothetical protein